MADALYSAYTNHDTDQFDGTIGGTYKANINTNTATTASGGFATSATATATATSTIGAAAGTESANNATTTGSGMALVLVNGRQVTGDVILHDGDVIQVGKAERPVCIYILQRHRTSQ
jgi:hypothetical protein